MQNIISSLASVWYKLPKNEGHLEFPAHILEYMSKYQQTCFWHKEAGGQLFWEYTNEGKKRVSAITGPRNTDQRSRYRYKPDHTKEQREIDEFYNQGLYLLGDWHTHAQKAPKPSTDDIHAIQEIFSRSINPGAGLLLVIVGTAPIRTSINVSFCTSSGVVSLNQVAPPNGNP